MDHTLSAIFSFSIGIAAIISWIRFKRIDPAYYPFLYCIWIALLNEIISFIIIRQGYHNAINNNIYVLAESLLITWQFKRWGTFSRLSVLYYLVLFLFTAVWIADNFFISSITHHTLYFRLFYLFVLVLLSINMINVQIVRERKNILKNATFLTCIGFVIFFTYQVLVYVFWFYGLGASRQLRINILSILPYINLFTNLIYALAVLWMPTKQRFTLPS